jgi:4-amino-4-deoxy-L-arabinose transferase-like glycosyltransferase
MNKVTNAIQQHPLGVFAAFLALHAVVWTALPAIFFRNLPLDLIEALVYGREWQLGYDKLPPLPWWLVEATYRVFGRDVAYYALSQIAVITAFALVWHMGRQLIGPAAALVAVFIIDGLHYFTFTAPKFNHDVVQLPFWALAGYAYWAALRRGRMLHWLLLGFAVGMAFWAKYFVLVLAVPMVLFALFDRDARKVLLTPGPYVAAAVALAIAAPHLIWLIRNDFVPFAYAESRARHFRGALDYVAKPFDFLLSQLNFLWPSLLIVSPFLRRDMPRPDEAAPGEFARSADAFDRRIVTLLAFGPTLTLVLLSVVTGRSMVAIWGYPLWLFLGLWIMMHGRLLERVTLWRVTFVWGVVFVCYVAAFVIAYVVRPRVDQDYIAVLFPGERLAQEMSRRYRAMTGQPLAYVIGTMWVGGNISHYAPEHPRVLIDGRPARAPWIDLGDLRAKGAIVVWTDENPNVLPIDYRGIADQAEIQPGFTLPMQLGANQVVVGWAVLRPRPVVAGINSMP